MGLTRSEWLALVGIVVEITFFVTEMVMGERTKSVALVADSYRVLTDAISLLVSGICASRVEHLDSKRNTFGWVRADVLGAFINGIFLIATLFSITVESLKRLVTVQELEDPYIVLALGGVGLVINTVVLFLFGTKAYRHMQKEKKTKNLPSAIELVDGIENQNIASATETPTRKLSHGWLFIHVLGNFFGSLTIILIAALSIYGKYDWCHYADPVLTIAMVAILVTSTCPLLKDSAHIMLQTVPQHFDVDVLKSNLKKQIPGLINIHEFHVWQLTGKAAIATLHFVSYPDHDYVTTIQAIKDFMQKQGFSNVTIQPEILQEEHNVIGSTQCILTCSDHDQCASKTCCHSAHSTQDHKHHHHHDHGHSCHGDHENSIPGSDAGTQCTEHSDKKKTKTIHSVIAVPINQKSIIVKKNCDSHAKLSGSKTIKDDREHFIFEHVTTV